MLHSRSFPLKQIIIFNFSAETKYFNCQCVRCEDPTEMGTMFSSIRCPQCTVEQVCLGLTKKICKIIRLKKHVFFVKSTVYAHRYTAVKRYGTPNEFYPFRNHLCYGMCFEKHKKNPLTYLHCTAM